MVHRDWGILIDRTSTGQYRVLTVARIQGELRSHPFDVVTTEAKARARANREWLIQTGRG
jgi:hypothetical protein